MAIDWAPALVKAVGFRPLNDVLKCAMGDIFGPDQYRLFADMIVRASDEEMPFKHTHWRIWRLLLIRFHLFEITVVKAWVALISRFDTRGVMSPYAFNGYHTRN